MCPQQVDRRGSCKHHMRRGIETRPVITPSTRFRCCRPNSNSVKCSFSSSRQLKATDPHPPGRSISGQRGQARTGLEVSGFFRSGRHREVWHVDGGGDDGRRLPSTRKNKQASCGGGCPFVHGTVARTPIEEKYSWRTQQGPSWISRCLLLREYKPHEDCFYGKPRSLLASLPSGSQWSSPRFW